MSDKTNSVEKRKHRRYTAKEGAFAVVTSDDNKIGQINNISKSGLSFRYIANGKPSNGMVEIEIFSTTNDFYLKKLSANVIVDADVGSQFYLSSLPLRELVVQFEKMNPNQMLLLDYFIKNYTTKT